MHVLNMCQESMAFLLYLPALVPLARILSLDRCNVELWVNVRRNMLHKVVDIAKWIKTYTIIKV